LRRTPPGTDHRDANPIQHTGIAFDIQNQWRIRYRTQGSWKVIVKHSDRHDVADAPGLWLPVDPQGLAGIASATVGVYCPFHHRTAVPADQCKQGRCLVAVQTLGLCFHLFSFTITPSCYRSVWGC
jgi:hypothetical protein